MSQPTSGPNQPIRPEVVAEPARGPLRVVLEQPRSGWIGKRLLWIALVISVLINFGLFSAYHSYVQSGPEIEEKWHSLDKRAADKVAIIAVEGTILGDEGFVKRQIDRVRDDDDVNNLVDVHLSHLRKKIDRPPLAPLIHTVWGRGYRLGPAH